jgi:bifunctional non-homologous end joining protein LigD
MTSISVRPRPPSKRQYVAQPPPAFAEFQHPKLVTAPPVGDGWIHEIKFDGYRMQIRVERGSVTIWTRNGHDFTHKLPELAEAVRHLAPCIIDGELCALDAKGMPSFSKLRASMSPGKTGSLIFFAFDLMWQGTDDLRSFKLIDRKARLASVFEDIDSDRLRMVDALPSGGKALLESACKLGLEGIVSKRRDAPYSGGRSDAWVKSKCRPGQEVVIGGWVQEPGRAFKSILVGTYENARFRFAGTVKSGFKATPDLPERLRVLETDTSPFEIGGAPRQTSEIHWVEPRLVANVQISEWTDGGKLRQSTFQGLREDKDPRIVVREVPTD